MQFTIIVLVSAMLLAGASARGGRRAQTKIQSNCLSDGGISQHDMHELIDDLSVGNWATLRSKQNMCIVTCMVYDRITPTIKALGLYDRYVVPLLGTYEQCLPQEGPNVCESARVILPCVITKALSTMMHPF